MPKRPFFELIGQKIIIVAILNRGGETRELLFKEDAQG